MSDVHSSSNYREITQLSSPELARRAKGALDAFIKTVKQGGNVAEKAQLYNAYQDERLKRVTLPKMHVVSAQIAPSSKTAKQS